MAQTSFADTLRGVDPDYLATSTLQTLQVNLGNLCNLACRHCHQEASPQGDKIMGRSVMGEIAAFLGGMRGLTLDITGGAPEANPDFRYFVESTEGLAQKRILRSNLTVMDGNGMEWLPGFCREQGLAIVASLPCYLEENVDRQRGGGVHGRSIEVLRRLNELGYGSEIELNLVYNPGAAYLPANQGELERAYRDELQGRYGIVFTKLFTITNAPLGRFAARLREEGKYDSYMMRLIESFNPEAAGNIMCRSLISVDWQGYLYNCDFNQVTGLKIRGSDGSPMTISALASSMDEIRGILFAPHCYCCTAGEGSSCSGALAAGS